MNEQDVAVTITAWVRDVLPELLEGRHYLSMQKTQLPDVEVDVAEKTIAPSDSRFPALLFEQVAVRVFEVECALMTSIDPVTLSGEDHDQAETEQLRDFGARLEASLLNDGTLGGRVFAASPIVRFNYRLPFVQYGDGTRGRQMTVQFPVAEPVQPEAD